MELIYCILLLASVLGIIPSDSNSECFCQLTGYLDDCSCEIETLDKYNNKVIYPQLHQILERNFFRYYKGLINNYLLNIN